MIKGLIIDKGATWVERRNKGIEEEGWDEVEVAGTLRRGSAMTKRPPRLLELLPWLRFVCLRHLRVWLRLDYYSRPLILFTGLLHKVYSNHASFVDMIAYVKT